MSANKGHNFNPDGEVAQNVMKRFRKNSREMWQRFKNTSAGKPELVIHGLELEGFITRPDGHIAAQAAEPILKRLDDRFCVESGGHQIEFTSAPRQLGETDYDTIVAEVKDQRQIVEASCRQSGFDFITRSIPLNLPRDPETSLDLFTEDSFFVEHRAYDREVMGLLEEPFEVKYADGEVAFGMRDYTLGLALISGVHNNISFAQPETAIAAFNLALQLSPLVCALGANGSSLSGRVLSKRDMRLHIGLMSECVRVKVDHVPYLDAGLPVPLVRGWDEYIDRLSSIGFMLADDELKQNEENYLALYDNLREQSWAFAKIKLFPDDRLGIEFRPLSAQCNSEANAAYHMYIVWLLVTLLQEGLAPNSWEGVGLDIQAALRHGPNAEIQLNGKRQNAVEHFGQINEFLLPKLVQRGLATPESFSHITGIIRQTMAFNALELQNYDSYRTKIVYDFSF